MQQQINSDSIPIGAIFSKIVQNWYYFVASVAIAILLSGLYLKRTVPQYQVDSTMLLDNKAYTRLNSDHLMKEMGFFEPGIPIEDQLSILASYPIISKTVKRIQLSTFYFKESSLKSVPVYLGAPFHVVMDSNHTQIKDLRFTVQEVGPQTYQVSANGESVSLYFPTEITPLAEIGTFNLNVQIMANTFVDHPHCRFKIVPTQVEFAPDAIFSFEFHDHDYMVTHFQNSLSVSQVDEESNIISLATVGPLIEFEQVFLNNLMEVFIEEEFTKQNKLGERILAFIDHQLEATADSLKIVENQLVYARSSSSLINIESTSEGLTEQFLRLDETRSNMQAELQYYEFIQSNLQSSDQGTGIPAPSAENINDPLLSSLLEELLILNREKSNLEFSTTDRNPQHALLDKKIERISSILVENLGNKIESTKLKIADLDSRIEILEAKVQELPVNEQRITSIDRKFTTISDFYKYLLEKRAEIGLALANLSTESYIIDKARLKNKKPVSPNKIFVYLIALVAGFGIPFAAILGKDMLNKKILSVQDLEISTEIPLLGVIMANPFKSKLITQADSQVVIAENFRSLRIHLKYMEGKGKDLKVIGFTSSSKGEGKSFCAANLSSTLALAGKKTLLVDLDMRSPSIIEYLDYDNSRGMYSYLTGIESWDSLVQVTQIDNLFVLPSGPPHFNPLDLIDSQRLLNFVKEAREAFDYIIIDTPPLGQTSDYILLKEIVDYTVYVVRHNYTEKGALGPINFLYGQQKISEIGVLVNAIDSMFKYKFGKSSYTYDGNYGTYGNYGYGMGNSAYPGANGYNGINGNYPPYPVQPTNPPYGNPPPG